MYPSLKAVHETLQPIGINLEVEQALDPDRTSPLPSERDNYAPNCYSPLFRAYSAACSALNRPSPLILVDRVVEVPPEAGWLGSRLLELLNGSLVRDSNAAHQFTSRTRSRSTVCAESENLFLQGLGYPTQGIEEQAKTQTVYVDEDSKPILFTMGVQIRTSISFADIAINGITHPAGTICRARKKSNSSFRTITPGLEMGSLDNISSIQPLRMSLFPIPLDERLEVVINRPIDEVIAEEKLNELSKLPDIAHLGFFLRNCIEKYAGTADRESDSFSPSVAYAV